MRLLLVTGIFFVWALAALRNPAFGAGLLLWVDVAAPLEIAYSTGSYPISLMALGVMLGSFVINVLGRGFRPQPNFFTFLWLIFMAWAAFCAFQSPFPKTSWAGWFMSLKYLGPLLVVSLCTRTVRDSRFLAYSLTIAMGVWGAQTGIGCLKNGVNKNMHIQGTQMGDNNFFAGAIVAIIPMFLFIIWNYTGKFKLLVRAGALLAMLLCFSTIVFSNSRGASLGLIGNVVLYLIFISRRKVRDWALALTLGAAIVAVLPQSFWDRMNTLQDVGTEQAEGSAKERMLLVQSTSRAVMDYPIFGIGPYSWVEISTAYTGLEIAMQPHNIWLKCAVELGFPGVFLFALLVFGTIFRTLWVRRDALRIGDKASASLALALASGQIGYIISLTFLSNWDLEYQWAWLAVGNAFVAAWRNQAAAQAAKQDAARIASRG